MAFRQLELVDHPPEHNGADPQEPGRCVEQRIQARCRGAENDLVDPRRKRPREIAPLVMHIDSRDNRLWPRQEPKGIAGVEADVGIDEKKLVKARF